MKYRSVASKGMIAFIFVAPACLCLPFLIVFCFIPSQSWQEKLQILLVMYLASCALFAIVYRNAYCVFELNEHGMKNGMLMLCWEEIEDFDVQETRLLEYNFLPVLRLTSIVYFGNARKDKGFTTLIFQDRKKCVFFSITPKNIEKLRLFGSGKSAAVDRFLETYGFLADQEKG